MTAEALAFMYTAGCNPHPSINTGCLDFFFQVVHFFPSIPLGKVDENCFCITKEDIELRNEMTLSVLSLGI